METETTMQKMDVNVASLRVGELVAEDILANTKYPIVNENTKITYEHLHIFDVFNIKTIPVLRQPGDEGEAYEEEEVEPEQMAFNEVYAEAIEQFKKEFRKWESNVKVDITAMRGIILPITEMVLEDRSIIFNLNNLSNKKDYLYHHCIATGLITAVLAQKLGYDYGVTLQMALGGVLADSGMAKIPVSIRDKSSALTESEFNEVRKHPIYSYQLVRDVPALKPIIKTAIFQHHERLDGSGYPKGDKGTAISREAQVISVADVFHAMTSERAYREKQPSFKVIEKIKEEEFGKFDIQVIQALMSIVSDLSIGSKVLLSNLEHGEVMFVNHNAPTRPLVKLKRTGEFIDLEKHRNIYIQHLLK